MRWNDHMGGEFTALPAHFKNHGYHTVSIGKVFHHMHDREADWSVPPWRSAAIPVTPRLA